MVLVADAMIGHAVPDISLSDLDAPEAEIAKAQKDYVNAYTKAFAKPPSVKNLTFKKARNVITYVDSTNSPYFQELIQYANEQASPPFTLNVKNKYYYQIGDSVDLKKIGKVFGKRKDYGPGFRNRKKPIKRTFLSSNENDVLNFINRNSALLTKMMSGDNPKLKSLGSHPFLCPFVVSDKFISKEALSAINVTKAKFSQTFDSIKVDLTRSFEHPDEIMRKVIPTAMIHYLPYVAQVKEPKNILNDDDIIYFITNTKEDIITQMKVNKAGTITKLGGKKNQNTNN